MSRRTEGLPRGAVRRIQRRAIRGNLLRVSIAKRATPVTRSVSAFVGDRFGIPMELLDTRLNVIYRRRRIRRGGVTAFSSISDGI